MSAGVLSNTMLRMLSAALMFVYLTLATHSHASVAGLGERTLAIDAGRFPPFTLLAIETMMPMKSRQFDSASLRVMGIYGLGPANFQADASKGTILIAAESPYCLLQTVKKVGSDYRYETGSALLAAKDNRTANPAEESLFDQKYVPILDPNELPNGVDVANTQLWHDLNRLADSTTGCDNEEMDCAYTPCCTDGSCQANEDDSCRAGEPQCADDNCQAKPDRCNCCCSAESGGGAIGSGYFGYGAGGGGGFGFGSGGTGGDHRHRHNDHPATPAPEPSTYLIMVGGALVIAAVRARRHKTKGSA